MWLSRYLEYTNENEAPELFHYWCGMAVLGHALNRKVWLDQHYDKLYPGQIMVALVSDSAVSRKSTAINISLNLLGMLPDQAINIVSGKISNATLADSLVRFDEAGTQLPGIGILVADELGLMFTKESWAETLVTDITALNTQCDRPFRRRMRNGDVTVIDPCLGALLGTTPTGLAHEVPKAAQTAGFLGRLLTVYADETDRVNDLIDAPPKHKALKAWLIKDLYRISEMKGEFYWTEDGKAYYRAWYKKWREDSPKGSNEKTGFYGRKHSHILRIAMVLSAARDSSRMLDALVLETAVRSIGAIEREMPIAFRKLDNNNPLMDVQERIMYELSLLGGRATRTLLLKKCYTRCGPYFDSGLVGLIKVGKIRSLVVKTKTKPTQWLEIVQPKAEMLENAVEHDQELDAELALDAEVGED